jgi:hypothetical protein
MGNGLMLRFTAIGIGMIGEGMAYNAWITTSAKWCERAESDVTMMERRIYPAEIMPDFPGYRVTARKCSLGVACNLAGLPCKWAYRDVGADRFEPTV